MTTAVIIERLMEVSRCKTKTQLAQWLEVSNSTLSMWLNRNSIRWDIVINKCIEHNISIDYVIGIGNDKTELIFTIISQQQTIYNLSSVKRKQRNNGDKAQD